MARAGSVKLPALLLSRLWYNSRMSSCQVDGPGATPGSRTNSLQAARQHAAESPKLSLLRAARRQPAIFIWGRGRQAMHLPCKQGYVGALPTDSTSLRSKRSESEGCRAEAERRRATLLGNTAALRATPRQATSASMAGSPSGLRLGQPIFNCGKLDQCTERSLINFFRWV